MRIKDIFEEIYNTLKPFPSDIEDRRLSRRIYRKIVYPLGVLSWFIFIVVFIILDLVNKDFREGWNELR